MQSGSCGNVPLPRGGDTDWGQPQCPPVLQQRPENPSFSFPFGSCFVFVLFLR